MKIATDIEYSNTREQYQLVLKVLMARFITMTKSRPNEKDR